MTKRFVDYHYDFVVDEFYGSFFTTRWRFERNCYEMSIIMRISRQRNQFFKQFTTWLSNWKGRKNGNGS